MADDSPAPGDGPEASESGQSRIFAALASRPDLWELVDGYINLVRVHPDQADDFERRFPATRVGEDAGLRLEAIDWLRRTIDGSRDV